MPEAISAPEAQRPNPTYITVQYHYLHGVGSYLPHSTWVGCPINLPPYLS